MIASGILTAASFVIIGAKLKPETRKKILGRELTCESISHVLFLGIGAMSGTFSGIMSAIIATLFVSATLRIAKKCIGYMVYENGKWVEYPGTWTVKSVTLGIIESSKKMIAQVQNGITEGIEQSRISA